MRNLYHVMSASDDSFVRLFDLVTSKNIMKLKAHKVSNQSNLLIVEFLRINVDTTTKKRTTFGADE